MKKILIAGFLIATIIIGFNFLNKDDNTFNEGETNIVRDKDDKNLEKDKKIKDDKENINDKEDIKDGNNENEETKNDNTETDDSIKVKEENIIKSQDDVLLLAKKRLQNAVDGLELLIGKDKLIDVSDEISMNANLNITDLNNDKTKDIVIIEYLGGTGNIQNIYVYLRYGDDIIPALSPDNYISQESFSSEYLGNGDIYFKDNNTEFEITFNIGKPYEEEGMDLEEAKKRFGFLNKAWVDPYSSFEVKDINNDDVYEVLARQIICGIAHVDIIGEMETIYSYNNDKFIPTEVIYYKYDHNTWEKSEIGRSKVKK